MTIEERGLYREALDLQAIEGSIPRDLDVLRRMLLADREEFDRAWPKVSEKFVPHLADRLINLRQQDEIKRREDVRGERVKSGVKGGKQSGKVRKAKAKQMLQSCEALASKQRSKNEPDRERERDREREPNQTPLPIADANGRVSDGITFDWFYERYPKKVGRLKAAAIWKKSMKSATDRQLLSRHLDAWKAEFEGRDTRYIPNPKTFLDDGLWAEPPPESKTGKAKNPQTVTKRTADGYVVIPLEDR